MLKWRRQENISLSLFSFLFFSFFFSPFKTCTRSFKRGGVSAISKHVSITWYLTSWAINWLTVLQKWETIVWLKRLPDQIRASICPRPNFASSFPLHPGALPDLPVNLSVLLFSLSFRWVLIVGPSKNSSVCNQATKSFFFKIFGNIYILLTTGKFFDPFRPIVGADFRPNWAQNYIINVKIRAVNNQAD